MLNNSHLYDFVHYHALKVLQRKLQKLGVPYCDFIVGEEGGHEKAFLMLTISTETEGRAYISQYKDQAKLLGKENAVSWCEGGNLFDEEHMTADEAFEKASSWFLRNYAEWVDRQLAAIKPLSDEVA